MLTGNLFSKPQFLECQLAWEFCSDSFAIHQFTPFESNSNVPLKILIVVRSGCLNAVRLIPVGMCMKGRKIWAIRATVNCHYLLTSSGTRFGVRDSVVRKNIFKNILAVGGLYVFKLSLTAGPIYIPEPFPHVKSI